MPKWHQSHTGRTDRRSALHNRLLNYLDAAARLGSIRRAARELNVASSAINRQILALERELGTPIFERLPRGLRLTAAGEILIEHVRGTMKGYVRTAARIDALQGLASGKVTLALTPGLADGVIPSVVARFLEQRPGVQVLLRTMAVEAIAGAVLSSEADLGLGYYLLPNPGLQALMSSETRLGLVMAPDHPLALQTAVRLAEVEEHSLVLVEPGMKLRGLVDAAFARLSLLPKPQIETNSVQTLKRLIMGSRRLTLLNRLDVADECSAGHLAFRPLIAPYLDPQPLALVARRTPEPLAMLFAEELRVTLPKLVD
jgi:DNA-binding transcriptional LysR family regulator